MNIESLSINEAAAATGLSVSTLRRRLKNGAFEAAYCVEDGSWRIPISDLIAAGLTPRSPYPTGDPSTPAPNFGDVLAEFNHRAATDEAVSAKRLIKTERYRKYAEFRAMLRKRRS